MAGFDNDVLYGKNINFDSPSASHPGIITAAGQLLIGTGDNTGTIGHPAIKQGILNAASPGISATYNASTGNIDLAVGAVQAVTFQTQAGTAQAQNNIITINGAAGVTTSADGVGTITITGAGAGSTINLIPDSGVTPIVPNGSNQINVNGQTIANASQVNPVMAVGGVNQLKLIVKRSTALPAEDGTLIGLSNFSSNQFTVSANGFVQLKGATGAAILEVNVDTSEGAGTNPVLPAFGAVTITGGQVASGTVGANVLRTDSTAAGSLTVQIQRATSAAVATVADNGVSHFDSASFGVDTNGFVTLSPLVIGTITGNDLVALSQTAHNWNIDGTGSITTSGAGSTLTIALTGLTNHAVLVGAGNATITKVGPSALTGQILQNNAGGDPSYSTATYPSTTTINQILFSSANNVVSGLATATNGVLTTGATGIPAITQVNLDGELLIGSSSGPPLAATLTAGAGILITNASNQITIAPNYSLVGKTITGDIGGALFPTAGNWNILSATVAAGTTPIQTSGAGSTLTINLQKSQAIAGADTTKIGLSNFNSAQFTVDSTGFVGLKGSSTNPGILGIHPNAISGLGTDPTVADSSGNVSILGLSTAAGTNPVRTVATAANSITTLVQTSQAIAAADATKIGLCNFDSGSFNVDSNGFVTLASGAGIFTLSDDVNTKVSPSTGNIQLTGHVVNAGGNFSTTVSNAGSHLIAINPMTVARWIVDPLGTNGTHTTIASALTSASSGEDIFIMPGTYTENLTLKAGVNLVAWPADAFNVNTVKIVGKCSMTVAGKMTMSGIALQTNGDFAVSITGSNNTEIYLVGCQVIASNNTALNCSSSNSSAGIFLRYCEGSLNANVAFHTCTAGAITYFFCNMQNGGANTAACTCTTGVINIENSVFQYAINMTSSSGSLQISNCQIGPGTQINTTLITTACTGTVLNTFIMNSNITGAGTATPISISGFLAVINTSINTSNTTMIGGTGTLNYANVVATGTGSALGAGLTKVALTKQN